MKHTRYNETHYLHMFMYAHLRSATARGFTSRMSKKAFSRTLERMKRSARDTSKEGANMPCSRPFSTVYVSEEGEG